MDEVIPDIVEEIVAQDVDMKDNFWSFGGCPYLSSNKILSQEHDTQHIDESHGDITASLYDEAEIPQLPFVGLMTWLSWAKFPIIVIHRRTCWQ